MFAKKNVKNIYALTPMQEAMLFQALYDESSSAHFEQSFYHISGRLNVSIFEEAWNEVVRRHDILRTIFVHKDVPQPLQIVLKKRRISVCFKDIRSLSLEEQEAYCLEYRKKDWQQPFDLARDVLMRFALFQLDKESFNVVWSFHHILMDGWSGSVIHDEFYRIFRALAEGNRPALDQPVPFSLYIRWLKERDREGSGSYWREYLEGYNRPAGLALQKSDFSTPLQKEYDVGTLVSEFDETLTSALQNLASRNHVALNTIIQVMWGILLGKYNDLGDVVFGAVVSGRPAEINGIENMVGLLINLIPVRIRVKDSKTFRELALKVHEDSIRSKDHHYYPLAEIQAQTTLKQNLLDHVLVFENYPAETVLSQFQEKSEPDFVIDSFEHADHTNYDLNIQIAPEGGKLHFHIIYNCSVYDPGVIKNIGYHLEKIAKAVTENDEAEIEHIEVLLPGEKQEYLDARAEKDRTIHLYENLAEKTCTPGEYVPPENEQQEKLIEIWKEILATDSIGIDDNYIELGGHSIAAIQIVSRIHKILDVEIGLKEFFDNPSIKALDKIIQKRDLAEYEDIAPLAEQEHYEVSHSQGRLWILDKMEENFTAYNMSGAYMLEGPLNTQAFRRAFKIVEDRHESLRTTFTNLEGKPRQKIHKTTDFEVEEIDLTDKENNEHIAKKLAIEDANRLFDLETGPLLRVKLLKLSQDRYILVLTMHHIICDGWSFGVLENELLTLYNAFAQGRDPDLPCLKIQYKDYAFWQNRLLKGENIKAHQEYWQHKLSGELPALNMPTDYPRPAIQTYKGKTTRFFLDKTLTADLKKLAKENRASLFMTLLAAMKALLYRYTGQEDIIIGSPIAGRTHQDLEDQIGFYVNTLVLRDELMGDESFKTLLGKVRQTATEAYEHQIYPFDRLVEELDIQRDLSRSPIFDIMLVLQNNQKQEDLQDLKISWFEYETGISQFDLTFNFMEIGDELVLDINYRTDLFRDETIKRFENHFEELVKSIQKDENTLIKNINILSPEEKHRVLTEFNNTAADYPREKTIADLFEDQVKKTPENTALIFEEKHLTYRELDEQANEMAHFLRENYQVRQDDLVGVMAERNQGMIIALLGILKAGAAYLPIDPVYPRERIEYMTEDSGCKVVLEPTTGNQQPATSNLQPATSNQQPATSNLQSATCNLQPATSNLAYVIYTSGSTGKPKGVMIEHGGFVNMILAQIRGFEISESDHVLQFASPSFDASLSEIFMALLKGAALVLISKETIEDTGKFLKYIEEKNVSVITFPPLYLNTLNKHPLPTVKTIITAGEPAIKEDLVFYSKDRNCFNAYGPTETSVCTSFYKVNPDFSLLTSHSSLLTSHFSVPIGKPVSNSCVYIVDEAFNPVPIGIHGEICFSGPGTARGYLNQPELTSEKFVDNPLRPGERLYKIGDLGRWLPDGNIEFLGRKDGQVKIRGFRIELGEIESLLSQYPEIREAVVVATEDQAGNKRLAAYFTAPDQNPEPDEIRQYLRSKLPEYMVPSSFTLLKEIPLTPSGKADRRALPAPDISLKGAQGNYIAPRNSAELQLAQIWQDVLGVRPVSARDDFFDIGGHSLLAVQMMNQIQQKFGKHLPMSQFFKSPNIEQLALALQQDDVIGWEPLVEIQSNGTKPPIFFVPGVGGNVVYFQTLSRSLGADQPFYGLQSAGLDGKTKPLATVEDMAARYIEEIRKIQKKGPYCLGGHSLGGWIAYEISGQLQKQGEKTAFLAIIDVMSPGTHHEPLGTDWDDARWNAEIIKFLGMLYGEKLEISYDMLKHMGSDEQIALIKDCLEKACIFAPNSDISQIRGLMEVIKANQKVRYIPEKNHTTGITLFRAKETGENDTNCPELNDPAWGWSEFSSEPVKVYYTPGNHHTMMTEPHVKELAEQIKYALNPSG